MGKVLVPRRRKTSPGDIIANLPRMALRLFDADFIFQKTKTFLFYGFAPAVILKGMMTEPQPASWFEIINILE